MPPLVQKKPLAEVKWIEKIMKMTMESAAGRVNRPSTSSDAADRLGAADQRAPEHAGLIAEPLEQRGVGVEAHAAEHAEQLLTAVRNQDEAKAGAQHRQHKRLERAQRLPSAGI